MAQAPLTPGEVATFVGVKMPAADNDFLADLARSAGITKSEVVRRIIAERRRREGPGPPDGGQPPTTESSA